MKKIGNHHIYLLIRLLHTEAIDWTKMGCPVYNINTNYLCHPAMYLWPFQRWQIACVICKLEPTDQLAIWRVQATLTGRFRGGRGDAGPTPLLKFCFEYSNFRVKKLRYKFNQIDYTFCINFYMCGFQHSGYFFGRIKILLDTSPPHC